MSYWRNMEIWSVDDEYQVCLEAMHFNLHKTIIMELFSNKWISQKKLSTLMDFVLCL